MFTFGAGVALPTRMRFQELPAAQRPNSEASGNTRSDAGTNMSKDLISSVIDRWRSATMSHRMGDDEFSDYGESPSLQPAPAPAPAPAAAPAPIFPSPRGDMLRASLLKKPLDASLGTSQASPPGYSPRPR